MTIQVGDRLPKATLIKATPDGPQPVDSEEYFRGRRVALFSVPGAFTPTCSARHLPGFVDKIDELRAKGVDEVACTAVNDAFVLQAWAASAGAEGKVTMLADGNGDFVKAIGLDADFSKFAQARPAFLEAGQRRGGRAAQRRGARRVQRQQRGLSDRAALSSIPPARFGRRPIPSLRSRRSPG